MQIWRGAPIGEAEAGQRDDRLPAHLQREPVQRPASRRGDVKRLPVLSLHPADAGKEAKRSSEESDYSKRVGLGGALRAGGGDAELCILKRASLRFPKISPGIGKYFRVSPGEN